jgi:hypothetical protein
VATARGGVGADMNDETVDDGDWEFMVPFIACSDNGGPYEPAAFVAGFIAGGVHATLRLGPPTEFSETLPNDELIDQLDLLAMHRGWTVTREPLDDDAWELTFHPPTA